MKVSVYKNSKTRENKNLGYYENGMSDMKNISDNCFTDDGSIQKIKDGVKSIVS